MMINAVSKLHQDPGGPCHLSTHRLNKSSRDMCLTLFRTQYGPYGVRTFTPRTVSPCVTTLPTIHHNYCSHHPNPPVLDVLVPPRRSRCPHSAALVSASPASSAAGCRGCSPTQQRRSRRWAARDGGADARCQEKG